MRRSVNNNFLCRSSDLPAFFPEPVVPHPRHGRRTAHNVDFLPENTVIAPRAAPAAAASPARNNAARRAPGLLAITTELPLNISRMSVPDVIRIERPVTDSKIFAHTRWDALPTLAGLFHLAYFFAPFFLYPRTPLWLTLILGFVYALMINANINGVGHNFIHNPFFRAPLLNRLFSLCNSMACCFSQTYYDVVHMQHHRGNADRPDDNGKTVDWISI